MQKALNFDSTKVGGADDDSQYTLQLSFSHDNPEAESALGIATAIIAYLDDSHIFENVCKHLVQDKIDTCMLMQLSSALHIKRNCMTISDVELLSF